MGDGYILRAALLKADTPPGSARPAMAAGPDRSGYRLQIRLTAAEVTSRPLAFRRAPALAVTPVLLASPPARLGEHPAWTDPPEA